MQIEVPCWWWHPHADGQNSVSRQGKAGIESDRMRPLGFVCLKI